MLKELEPFFLRNLCHCISEHALLQTFHSKLYSNYKALIRDSGVYKDPVPRIEFYVNIKPERLEIESLVSILKKCRISGYQLLQKKADPESFFRGNLNEAISTNEIPSFRSPHKFFFKRKLTRYTTLLKNALSCKIRKVSEHQFYRTQSHE